MTLATMKERGSLAFLRVRGGRMTKFKGQVSSIAPLLGMAVSLLAGPSITCAQSVGVSGGVLYSVPVTSPTWNAGGETYIGDASFVTVDGAGSTLTQNGGPVFVGAGPADIASIIVANGGTVIGESPFVGFNGATGTVTVTEPESTWSSTNIWRVGYSDTTFVGTGAVNVLNDRVDTTGQGAVFGLN